MSGSMKIAVIVAVVLAVGIVFAVKQSQKSQTENEGMAVNKTGQTAAATGITQNQQVGRKLPKLIDLGAGKCIPCKAMKPILEDLKANYAQHFETIFIDVWEDSSKGREYGIRAIPTQIFFDADGKELFRHEGFYGKEDILAKWKELGVDTSTGAR